MDPRQVHTWVDDLTEHADEVNRDVPEVRESNDILVVGNWCMIVELEDKVGSTQ